MKAKKPFIKEVGRKVKEYRMQKGISIRYLGKISGCEYSGLSRFENGLMDIKLSSLKHIADALEVDIKNFL